MPAPGYGAPPLAKTFLLVRALQMLCFIIIVGVTANFVAEIVSQNEVVAKEIVGTLTTVSGPPTPSACFVLIDESQTCIVAFYCLISIAFFWAEAKMGLLIMCIFDFLFLLAFVVVAVVLGKPLSYLNCAAIDNTSAGVDAASAFAFTQSVGQNIKGGNFFVWSGATKANCYEAKVQPTYRDAFARLIVLIQGVWGISIGLW